LLTASALHRPLGALLDRGPGFEAVAPACDLGELVRLDEPLDLEEVPVLVGDAGEDVLSVRGER
jgi:hypothetical protein